MFTLQALKMSIGSNKITIYYAFPFYKIYNLYLNCKTWYYYYSSMLL